MKKLFLISMLALASCATAHFTMGMTEADFLKENPHADLVEARSNIIAVYKIHIHDSSHNEMEFFYFKNGLLFEIDHGHPRPDITIDKTVHNE